MKKFYLSPQAESVQIDLEPCMDNASPNSSLGNLIVNDLLDEEGD